MKAKIYVELFMRQQQRGFDELCCIYCVSVCIRLFCKGLSSQDNQIGIHYQTTMLINQ